MKSKRDQYPLNSPLLATLRPHQWTKNLIVFAAPLFAFQMTTQAFIGGVIAFVLFCAISGSFYIINDVIDVEADRLHPVKCKRPIAAGLVEIRTASSLAFSLIASSIILGTWRSPYLGVSLFSYGVVQIIYNNWLKRRVILDVIAIASGFVLRALGGGAATNITLSPWLLLCTAMLALFLAIEKRKAELRLHQIKTEPHQKTRAVLKLYSLPLLQKMENVATTGVIFSYASWSAGQGGSTSWMFITLPFVIYGVFRYQFLSDPAQIIRNSRFGNEQDGLTEHPEEILLRDRHIFLTVIGWLLTVFIILLLKSRGIIS